MLTKTDIEKYFTAEKNESLLFMLIGFVAIVAAAVLYFYYKTPLCKGMAIPLLAVALIQLVVGYTVYKRSDSDRIRNVYAYDMKPDELQNKELPRMKQVNRNFVIYRWIELFLLGTGTALVLRLSNNPDKTFLFGIGLGLAIQAGIMLCADYFAERRAASYTIGLIEYLSTK